MPAVGGTLPMVLVGSCVAPAAVDYCRCRTENNRLTSNQSIGNLALKPRICTYRLRIQAFAQV